MSDLSAQKDVNETEASGNSTGLRSQLRKLVSRTQDWFAVQSTLVRVMVVPVLLLMQMQTLVKSALLLRTSSKLPLQK